MFVENIIKMFKVRLIVIQMVNVTSIETAGSQSKHSAPQLGFLSGLNCYDDDDGDFMKSHLF